MTRAHDFGRERNLASVDFRRHVVLEPFVPGEGAAFGGGEDGEVDAAVPVGAFGRGVFL
ncbi:MAG TPA: hypothetical protein PLB22_03985 [Ottowia sp.]|nr:hypothetical protein [Ottowia sp.]